MRDHRLKFLVSSDESSANLGISGIVLSFDHDPALMGQGLPALHWSCIDCCQQMRCMQAISGHNNVISTCSGGCRW